MICKKRKTFWFNPPYNQYVSTNIAKIFLKLVDKRTHWLHKIFNRNTIKVSYSYMSNVQQLIKKHSNFNQYKKNKTAFSCTCRDKNGCPSNGNCRMEKVICKCTSPTKSNVKKAYLGASEWEFKKNRYYNHQQLFRNKNYKNSTTLSTSLWSIKSDEQNLIWVGKECGRLLLNQTFQSNACYVCMRS